MEPAQARAIESTSTDGHGACSSRRSLLDVATLQLIMQGLQLLASRFGCHALLDGRLVLISLLCIRPKQLPVLAMQLHDATTLVRSLGKLVSFAFGGFAHGVGQEHLSTSDVAWVLFEDLTYLRLHLLPPRILR